MIKKVTIFLTLFVLMVVTLSQLNTVNAKGGNGKPTSPVTSPKYHGNPHDPEATYSGVSRILSIN